MEAPFLLLFGGLLYLLLLGGLLLLRREGLSIRFAVEGLMIIALAGGWFFVTGKEPNPLLCLLLLSLVTLRVHILIDLGRLWMARRQVVLAEYTYHLAEWLAPDPASRVRIRFHQAQARLEAGDMEKAIETFQGILRLSGNASLGSRFEAACHYYLGLAYQRQGFGMQAIHEFKLILDTWPISEYARRAAAALNLQAQEMLETQI